MICTRRPFTLRDLPTHAAHRERLSLGSARSRLTVALLVAIAEGKRRESERRANERPHPKARLSRALLSFSLSRVIPASLRYATPPHRSTKKKTGRPESSRRFSLSLCCLSGEKGRNTRSPPSSSSSPSPPLMKRGETLDREVSSFDNNDNNDDHATTRGAPAARFPSLRGRRMRDIRGSTTTRVL